MFVPLLIALIVGIITDAIVTKGTKVGWMGTVAGFVVFGIVAIVALGLTT